MWHFFNIVLNIFAILLNLTIFPFYQSHLLGIIPLEVVVDKYLLIVARSILPETIEIQLSNKRRVVTMLKIFREDIFCEFGHISDYKPIPFWYPFNGISMCGVLDRIQLYINNAVNFGQKNRNFVQESFFLLIFRQALHGYSFKEK